MFPAAVADTDWLHCQDLQYLVIISSDVYRASLLNAAGEYSRRGVVAMPSAELYLLMS